MPIYNGGSSGSSITGSGNIMGFGNYNNTLSSVSLISDVWTNITNNGLGSSTLTTYLPEGVTNFMDTPSGNLNLSELSVGDMVFVRNDFTVTPSTNNQLIELRYLIGAPGSQFSLIKNLGRMDSGGSVEYRFTLVSDKIYIGSDATKNNPIEIQIRSSGNGSFLNSGTVITAIKY